MSGRGKEHETVAAETRPQKKGWFARLGQGLARTSSALSDKLS